MGTSPVKLRRKEKMKVRIETEIQCPHLRGTIGRKVSCLAGLWHLDCRACIHPDKRVVEIRKDLDNWKLEVIVCNHENRH